MAPAHVLFDGERPARFRWRFRADEPVNLRVSAVRRRTGNAVRAWRFHQAEPGHGTVRWNGADRTGDAAPDGRYQFRIGPVGAGQRFGDSVALRGHAFPVAGPHGTRGALGEFGAPRLGGRTHEGFDVTAACGTPLLAARGGRVQSAGYDPALRGHFIRIDSRRSRQDHLYAHLRRPARFADGDRVHTGAKLGEVGRTGNAASTPCHLHFEILIDGRPTDPEPNLRRWDRRS